MSRCVVVVPTICDLLSAKVVRFAKKIDFAQKEPLKWPIWGVTQSAVP